MIGGPDASNPLLYEQIRKQCQALANLDFLGFQPFEKADHYFKQAKVFINTSLHEGFPNTFLQAWSRGIPVISFVDPDDVIQKNNLGAVVRTESELAWALRNLLDGCRPNPDHIKTYFHHKHAVGVIEKYLSLFASLGMISDDDLTSSIKITA